jgi:hypothetical protein
MSYTGALAKAWIVVIAFGWAVAAVGQTSPSAPASSTEVSPSRNRTRVAVRDTAPPAARGVGVSNNQPDCSQKRGIEKAECERRDTSRDDLPAGVTTKDAKPQPK